MRLSDMICLETFKERFERINKFEQSDRQKGNERLLNDFEAVFEIENPDSREQSEIYEPMFDFYEKLKLEAAM